MESLKILEQYGNFAIRNLQQPQQLLTQPNQGSLEQRAEERDAAEYVVQRELQNPEYEVEAQALTSNSEHVPEEPHTFIEIRQCSEGI